jgi:hypothetical protein
MHQDWGKLLFMHWRIDEGLVRPLVPKPLNLDLYGGSAWIGITPFTIWDIRALPPLAPGVPGLSSMHELNVRTYVYYDGVPGVWFFSLDVNSELAASAARTVFYLPYHYADIELYDDDEEIEFEMQRDSDAEFTATWSIGKELPLAQPGSREFFLTERYCLYTENEGDLYRTRIHHQPWPLRAATLEELDTNLFEANRLPVPRNEPLVHYADEVNVDIWYLEKVEG